MEFIYDSDGINIGYFQLGHFWTMEGAHIALFRVNEGIFINRAGTYVGEMYQGRIVYNQRSPHRTTAFGQQANIGTLGKMHQLPSVGPIMLPQGYVAFQS